MTSSGQIVDRRDFANQRTDSLPVAGDVDQDGQVQFSDFLILSANFGKQDNASRADGDLDGDGRVQFSDFLIFSANFGKNNVAALSVLPAPPVDSVFSRKAPQDDLFWARLEDLDTDKLRV